MTGFENASKNSEIVVYRQSVKAYINGYRLEHVLSFLQDHLTLSTSTAVPQFLMNTMKSRQKEQISRVARKLPQDGETITTVPFQSWSVFERGTAASSCRKQVPLFTRAFSQENAHWNHRMLFMHSSEVRLMHPPQGRDLLTIMF